MRWVAGNRQKYVFELEVLRSYAELTAVAGDPTDLVYLIDALFLLVLRAEIPREIKPTLVSIVEDLRRRHPDIDSLIERWTAIGVTLHRGQDSVGS